MKKVLSCIHRINSLKVYRRMIFIIRLLVVAGLAFSFMLVIKPVRADELDDINKQIAELTSAREQSVAATKPLEGELDKLDTKLKGIEAGIEKAKASLRTLEAGIAKREKDFSDQYVLLAERVLSFYKSSRVPNYLMILLASGPGGDMVRDLSYQQSVTDKDKDVITEITLELIELEKDKKKAEADKLRLAEIQIKLDKEADFFRGEIAGAKKYQASLSQEIASLTAKQQSIISQRQASLNLPSSLGAGPMMCVDDRDDKYNPGFSNAYAFFTYGIPHRVGMNQYGAYGRAKAGQDYKEILNAYFDGISFEGGKQDIMIKIQGNGERKLDEYLLGIYEMPESWDMNALKAQAVAARSYALSYTNNGANEICTTQACQVWKSDPKTGQWKQAVEQTKGEVMVNGGQVIKAWYSSTDGGYTFKSSDVWSSDTAWTKRLRDTTGDVGSFGELNDRAYDKESPCFYAAQGSRAEYNKSAWLKGEELADIANVIMLAKRDSGVGDHLYQTDKPHPYGGEIWNEDKVKQELRSRGGSPIDNATSASVGANFGDGRTTQVTINGIGFDGSEFKNWFNLRAPATIQIVGSLYNVEKR